MTCSQTMVRAPEVAMPVRHEVGYEELLKEFEHVISSLALDLVSWSRDGIFATGTANA